MKKNNYLITEVAGQDYIVTRKSLSNGFIFAPCNVIEGFAIFSPTEMIEIITPEPLCLIEDEQTIRDLIRIHTRLELPIEAINTN